MGGNDHSLDHSFFNEVMGQLREGGRSRINDSADERAKNRIYFDEHRNNGLQRYAGRWVLIDGVKEDNGVKEEYDSDASFESLDARMGAQCRGFIGYVPPLPPKPNTFTRPLQTARIST